MFLAQLLISACCNLTNRDVTQLGGESRRVFDSVNAALRDWFINASPLYTNDEDTTEIYSPVSLGINVTADSNQFTVSSGLPATGYANLAACVKQAIVIAGDGQLLNRIQSVSGSTGTLWRNYLGITGATTAILYTDAVTFAETDFEIVRSPVWSGPSSGMFSVPLVEWNAANPWMTGWVPEAPFSYYGYPIYYLTGGNEPVSVGVASPYWYMRIWPLPWSKGNVSYTIKRMPPCYSIADLATQRTVPVPDEFMPVIVDLAQRGLLSSPYWNKDCSREDTRTAINKAEAKIRGQFASMPSNSSLVQYGTPQGF